MRLREYVYEREGAMHYSVLGRDRESVRDEANNYDVWRIEVQKFNHVIIPEYINITEG